MMSHRSPWKLSDLQPPRAAKVPTERTVHGRTVTDDYEWLRQKENPQVIEHLEAENRYTEAVTSGLGGLRTSIFGEIKSRTVETDLSVPWRNGDWWYFRRTREGRDYPVFCRVPAATSGDVVEDWTPPEVPREAELEGEQILLDCNALAEPLPFFSLGSFDVTRDGRWLTYSVDDAGNELYDQYVKDLSTGELLPDVLRDVFGGAFLTPSGSHLIYALADDSWRPYEVRAHRIGTPADQDRVLRNEPDAALWLGAGISADERFLIIDAGCSEYSEIRMIALEDLDGGDGSGGANSGVGSGAVGDVVIVPRSDRALCQVEPVRLNGRDLLLISHDVDAPNGELVVVERERAEAAASLRELEDLWSVVVPRSPQRRINGFSLTAAHAVLSIREDGIEKIGFLDLEAVSKLVNGGERPEIEVPEVPEELYTAQFSALSVHSPVVRWEYSSFVVPARIIDIFPTTGHQVLRKEQPVRGGYDPADYTARREWAEAADGTRIPVSIVHRSDLDLTTAHPVVQYGYGSYESSTDPGFSIARLSLLDRGVIFAVAHVRGGGELGREWYLQGKKLAKPNTFTDFIAVTDYLAAQPWADAERIAADGASAGGLLMGAIANMAPEKYAGILAVVPFVDPLTSICDPSLPLTSLEWEEWGNPLEDPEVYDCMATYSPYENVHPAPYPPIAAVTSLNDTRVLYVEPAKWVPKLREATTGEGPILLRIEMDGGHGGGSGRYKRWEDIAWEYAFLLACLGLDHDGDAGDVGDDESDSSDEADDGSDSA